jgi:O-succinylbenzoate synthase
LVVLKITRFRTYRYKLPLKKTLVVGRMRLTHREGLILELGGERGQQALGEVAPLPGLNEETLQQATDDIARLQSAILDKELPEGLDLLNGAFERWLKPLALAPSVRFGMETAILGLIAAGRGLPLGRLISSKARSQVSLNALLTGSHESVLSEAARLKDAGYGTFKVKVGRRSLEKEIRLVGALRDSLGPAAQLRLDANRGWDVEQAVAAIESLTSMNIDYIEEPLQEPSMLMELASRTEMALPFALDESLAGVDPEVITFPSNVSAIILKPTVLGLEKTVQLARRAEKEGVKSVISSAFESDFGLKVLCHVAAAVNNRDVAAGLGTASWFVKGLSTDPPPINNGCLAVTPLPWTIDGLKGASWL